MAKLFFILTLVIFFIQWIYIIWKRKDYFNISTFFMIGIYLPMMLYFMNWSDLIEQGISEYFYMIFFYLNIFTILLNSFIKKSVNYNKVEIEIKKNHIPVIIINITFSIACLVENYIGSGFFLPAIHNIDIHTYRASILVYLTSSIFLVLLVNYIFFIKTKKARYLLWMIFLFLLPVIGKSSRMDAIMGAFGVLCFAIWERINHRKINYGIKSRKKIRIVLIILISALVINFAVSYGNYRMNNYGKYNISYSDGIQYNGPKFLSKIISVYYGYFPFSFNNLNINIKYTRIDKNFFGVNSFRGIYHGILQLDNIVNLPLNTSNAAKIIVTRAATVPTGFWDFYYDYGIACFIPIVISLIIFLVIKRKVTRENSNIGNYAIYFYWVPLWFFMSFNNTAYDVTVFSNMILIYIVCNNLLVIKHL